MLVEHLFYHYSFQRRLWRSILEPTFWWTSPRGTAELLLDGNQVYGGDDKSFPISHSGSTMTPTATNALSLNNLLVVLELKNVICINFRSDLCSKDLQIGMRLLPKCQEFSVSLHLVYR